jgi:hypothetical protein
MKIGKFVFASLLIAAIVCVLITVGMTVYQSVIDVMMNDTTQTLMRKAKYNNYARIRGVHTQVGEEENTGYGSIEILARYFGLEKTPVPDKNKQNWNNRDFREELQNIFPEYSITQRSNLRNTELVDLIYDALAAENPVIIFHAAEKPDEEGLEMRYSVVIGMDLANNRIILSDPHGTTLRYTLEAFIRSARFENYEITFAQRLLFSFRIYAKNTIFIVETDIIADTDVET